MAANENMRMLGCYKVLEFVVWSIVSKDVKLKYGVLGKR